MSNPAPAPTMHARADYEQVSLAEAGRILGYHRKTIERLCQRGELASIGRGRLRRIAISDITAYQSRNRNEGLN